MANTEDSGIPELPENADSTDSKAEEKQVSATGIYCFGKTIDPMEVILQIMVIAIVGGAGLKASQKPDFSWQEACGWGGALIGLSTFVHLSPTQRIDAYQKLFLRPPGDSDNN